MQNGNSESKSGLAKLKIKTLVVLFVAIVFIFLVALCSDMVRLHRSVHELKKDTTENSIEREREMISALYKFINKTNEKIDSRIAGMDNKNQLDKFKTDLAEVIGKGMV